jgi:hypothetical protein
MRKESAISAHLLRRCLAVSRGAAQRLRERPRMFTKPATERPCAGTLADLLFRSLHAYARSA